MLTWFRCPDKEIVEVPDCLYGKCRMGERCQPMAYLHLVADEREWTGKASTTQLINGTMYSFLKLTKPYIIDPDDAAYRVHGTKSHQQLDEVAKEVGIPSEFSTTNDGRNTVDAIEIEDGIITLTDYKRWGSYKVAKALGIVEVGKEPDPSGAIYKSSGKWGKAGSPKMVSVFVQDSAKTDNWEAELQLNKYAINLEDFGIFADLLRVHAMVRDGGLSIATSRGVFRNTYLIPVKRLPWQYVVDYFNRKEQELTQALEQGEWTRPCDDRECWEGNKCKAYCDVWNYCPKGVLLKEQDNG